MSNVYAIILEPFNASSLLKCSKEFLSELREICTRNDIILIFDEIYTGWSKTGELFYFMNFDCIPDILTYAKSFGGGKSSISGYTCRDHVFKKAYGNLNYYWCSKKKSKKIIDVNTFNFNFLLTLSLLINSIPIIDNVSLIY